MILKYFENKLENITNLEGIHNNFKMLDDFKGYATEEKKCLEMQGKIIEKAYNLGYKTECYEFIKNITISEVEDFKLRSFLSHVLIKTCILTGNIKHQAANDLANKFDVDLFHADHTDWIAINSALILRKNGFTSKSIDILEKYSFIKEDPGVLLNLAYNYSFTGDLNKETKIYEKLEKSKESWVHDVLFFRRATICIKKKKKNELKKLLASKDLYYLIKPIMYRNVRCLELYQIFSFLGDRCKAKFYLETATKSLYNKLETEVSSRKKAFEILEREF